jgi:pantetheine-phosphate adenylyltransferase
VRRAVCPGSFDPVTHGHLDIVRRASRLFDELVVAVGTNVSKSRLFDADERISMMRQACAGLSNVSVEGFSGTLPRSSRACAAAATSTTSCRWRR